MFNKRPGRLSFSLRGSRSEIARMFTLVERFCRTHRISQDDLFTLRLVLDEAVINIIVHGFADEAAAAAHRIDVALELQPGVVAIGIDDDGVAYNPLDAPAPRFDLPVEQRRIGGLGVHIIKTLARTVEYRREGGRNHLAITVPLGASSRAST